MAQTKLASGVLMKNDRKIDNDNSDENKKRPDYTGPATVITAGVEVEAEVAAWMNISDKVTKRLKVGDKYLVFQVREKWKGDVPSGDIDEPKF
jgi:hypothetical protein